MISDRFKTIIKMSKEQEVSDIHLKSGLPPFIRKNGHLLPLPMNEISSGEISDIITELCPDATPERVKHHAFDFSWQDDGIRYRCNAFHDMNGFCLSIRVLSIRSTDFNELRIPEILKTLSSRKSGLILITGPTGSGKTTTLTCLIDYINSTCDRHIVMLEDPIEYVHTSKKSIISQREMGTDFENYDTAIVESLREDPDIIMFGEMRDKTSIEAALRAAETGHLVLSTLHTKGAANTISRIIDVFPPDQQDQIIMQLSMSLIGVVSQQLIPMKDQDRLVLASEIMIGNVAMQNLIRQRKIHMIPANIELQNQEGMRSMRQALDSMLKEGLISRENFNNYQIAN